MARPRGYITNYQPRARTKALLADMLEVFREYADHLPLTARQVYYRLLGRAGYEKSSRLADRVQEHLVNARRARVIPFDWLRDDGAITDWPMAYASPEAFWENVSDQAHNYRLPRQAGQPRFFEVWCEAAGMAPQLARVSHNYGVPVFSGGGMSSLTARRDLVERIVTRQCPTTILYIGDHDSHGDDIFTVLREDVGAFVAEDGPDSSVEFVQVAVTLEQVRRHGLAASPDDEHKVQAEALPPDVLADTLRDAIVSRMDTEVFEAVLASEERQRAKLLNEAA